MNNLTEQTRFLSRQHGSMSTLYQLLLRKVEPNVMLFALISFLSQDG